MDKAKKILELINKAGISHSSICRALNVSKCDLSLTLNGQKTTASGRRILKDIEKYLLKVTSILRRNLEEGD